MKRFLYVFMILTLVLTINKPLIADSYDFPRLGIGRPSSGTVQVGGTIRYPVSIYYANNCTLKASDIRIAGVSANISVEGSGNTSRTIVLSNIQGSVGAQGYICYVAPGVATNDRFSSVEMNITSTPFTIVATVNNNPQPQPQPSYGGGNGGGGSYLPPSASYDPQTNTTTAPEEQTPSQEDDKTEPTMEIGALSTTQTEIGKEISFDITYNDDKEMGEITLKNEDLTLYGFKADINITGEGNTRKVTLSNIQGNLGGLKYIRIAANTAKDKAGNSVSKDGRTEMFKVVDKDTDNKPDDWIENPNTGR